MKFGTWRIGPVFCFQMHIKSSYGNLVALLLGLFLCTGCDERRRWGLMKILPSQLLLGIVIKDGRMLATG